MQETSVRFLGREDPLEKGQSIHCSILGLPWWLRGKEPACNTGTTGDADSILGLGRFNEEEMTTHSSMLAWKITWTEKPGLQSMGFQRVRHV